MEKNIKVKVELNVPILAIDEIIITALEGGSNYWAMLDGDDMKKASEWVKERRNKEIHYSFVDAILQGYEEGVRIWDAESDCEDKEDVLGVLSLENIVKNLPIAMNQYSEHYAQHIPEYNNGDATSADVLFQLFVLGNVTFG